MIPLAFLVLALPSHQDAQYAESLLKWRKEVEESLKNEGGWLSVAGLDWLKEGENDVRLPSGLGPESAGTVTFRNGNARLKVAAGVAAEVDGKPVTEVDLKPDIGGKPTKVKMGDATLTLIKRGKRTGIRLYNPRSRGRRDFRGLTWFEPNLAYRVRARSRPGLVFFNFKDTSNGKATYLAGRFLDTEKPKDGFVILDFNKAYNPPCAFTSYATCPLAPEANSLKIAIPAGEKNYHLD
ncbi:DUF1684 domain-containing protein [bacterium]|nr:MAG: DUF1684 domain-containing protein [bacterium]